MAISDYIVTIGLEVHCQIKTKSKMFCSCETGFGFEPNTRVCPTCLGLPGALPVLNEFAIERTLLTGLMLGCSSPEISQWDRKNYFYPDMAKNYQTSQLDLPLCLGGEVPLYPWSYPNDVIKAGVPPFRTVKLTRIHLEEDAAKITHHANYSLIDYNRAGSALMEIVSEPDIDTPEEAYAYLKSLQQILNYGDISDADMEKGQMRCDVNISVRPEGSEAFGTRTEIKNMNSITFITKAMEYEFERQVDLLESGGKVVQETLRYDDATNTTSPMRGKEDAHDYRYFRDPDLVTIQVTDEEIEEIRSSLPELPSVKLERYVNELGIPEADAQMLTKYRAIAEYFDRAAQGVKTPKTVSNFIIGQIFRRLETESDKEAFDIKTSPEQLKELVDLLDNGKIKNNLAKSALEKMLDSGEPVTAFISESDMGGLDDSALDALCHEAISSNPNAVSDYKGGKEKAIKALVGFVMKNSRGKADATAAEAKLKELIG